MIPLDNLDPNLPSESQPDVSGTSLLEDARFTFHKELVLGKTLSISQDGVASNADKDSPSSTRIGAHIASTLVAETATKLRGQASGRLFEIAVQKFVESTFPKFQSVRPGNWRVENVGGKRGESHISRYEPYRHLDHLSKAIERDPTLQSVLGNSYEISPDVLVLREPLADEEVNRDLKLVGLRLADRTVARNGNQDRPIVHAVISCKWTLRSDRAQNARSESLNLIRNRKGRAPHIAVVTGEPLPSRIASLALGTGDIDMVYHFALYELIAAVEAIEDAKSKRILDNLIDGERLRDITDLPLDLCV